MNHPAHWDLIGGGWRAWRFAAMVILATLGSALGQTPAIDPLPVPDSDRIEKLERLLQSVVKENQRLSAEVRALKDQIHTPQPPPPSPTLPAQTAEPAPSSSTASASAPAASASPPAAAPPASAGTSTESLRLPEPWTEGPMETRDPGPKTGPGSLLERFRIEYDGGFSIVPENIDETPFSLKVTSQDMIRYNGFARAATYWVNSAGQRVAIRNTNAFQIPRGRLIFSGKMLVPNLSYLLNIDYNTVTSNPIGFRAYELAYAFNPAFAIHAGLGKVPGSREWLESSFSAMEGPDRSMATTFFRPSLSQGVWFTGHAAEQLYYNMMLSNGFNTLNRLPNQLDNRLCWSGSAWWEPLGRFGNGYADIQYHEDPAIRLGGSYALALAQGNQTESDSVENNAIRLSDGTLVTLPGALAPNVTVESFQIALAAVDLAFKYRGLSLASEFYFQRLSSFEANGLIPITATSARGGFVQGGYFILPGRVELYSRNSFVTGRFGSGYELAGGLNWFILPGKANLRYTLDAAWLERSPAEQSRTGFIAGQTGFLLRTQVTVLY